MVFTFACSDPRYVLFCGRDKYENEHLIEHGWPEDVWFHVDKLSSAHIYLRLPADETLNDVPPSVVEECAQLTKHNSIEGCKLAFVDVIYTPWTNLKKSEDMAVGQVGMHSRAAVQKVQVTRDRETCKRMDRSKRERLVSARELFEERRARDRAELEARQIQVRREHKSAALEREARRLADSFQVETIYGIESIDDVEMARREAKHLRELERAKRAPAPAHAAGVSDADLCGDLFGDLATVETPAADFDSVIDAAEATSEATASLGDALAPDDDQVNVELAGELEDLVALAHKRKAEGRARALEAAARTVGDAETRLQEETSSKAAALARAAELRERVAARAGEETLKWAGSSEAGTLAAENRSAQADEALVLQSVLSEEDCQVFGESDESVWTSVRALMLHVEESEKRVELRVCLPPEYPSHLPPRIESLHGDVAAADAEFVEASLHKIFFDDTGTPCLLNWVEWLRDEWLRSGGGV